MNKIKIAFEDIEIESESAEETPDQLTIRVMNAVLFLIDKKAAIENARDPAEDGEGDLPGNGSTEIKAPEIIKPEIPTMYQ